MSRMNPIIPVVTFYPVRIRTVGVPKGVGYENRGMPILDFKDHDSEGRHEEWKAWIKREQEKAKPNK